MWTASGPYRKGNIVSWIWDRINVKKAYISQAKRPQACVQSSQRLILADTLGAEGLDSPVDDVARHKRHNELKVDSQIP